MVWSWISSTVIEPGAIVSVETASVARLAAVTEPGTIVFDVTHYCLLVYHRSYEQLIGSRLGWRPIVRRLILVLVVWSWFSLLALLCYPCYAYVIPIIPLLLLFI